MKGSRSQYSPSLAHRAAIAKANSKQNRTYDQKFSDSISKRNGKSVYVYDNENKLVDTYSSVIRFKKAYGIKCTIILYTNELVKVLLSIILNLNLHP